MRRLAGRVVMPSVVAGDDARRDPDRLQLLGGRPDHRPIGTRQEILASGPHDLDEALCGHCHDAFAIGWPGLDPVMEVLRLAQRGHAAPLNGVDGLRVVVVGEALGTERRWPVMRRF